MFLFLFSLQFFGFKNTFVQRLLRELVANTRGTPEQNFLSSISLRNETSEAVNQTELTVSKTDPSLLTHTEKPQSTGKRNMKGRTNNIKSTANTSLKKPRRQNKSSNIKASHSGQQEYGEHLPPFSSSKGSCNSAEALQESENLQTIIEREKVLVPVVESFDKNDHLIVDSLSSQEGRKHLNCETEKPVEEYTEVQKDGKLVSVLTSFFPFNHIKCSDTLFSLILHNFPVFLLVRCTTFSFIILQDPK